MKNVTFEHVKGVDEAKNELQEVVEFLKNPQKFTVLGGKLPKGRPVLHCIFKLDEKLCDFHKFCMCLFYSMMTFQMLW